MPAGPGVVLSEELFQEILPRVTDLAELKAILHVAYLASRSQKPAVPYQQLLASVNLRSIVGLSSPEPAETRLRRTLDRAVANGHLLQLTAAGEDWFLPATERSRAQLDRLRGGEEGSTEELGLPLVAEVIIHRPNVFSLYEQHIGPLTPLVAEQLRDAERSYPRAWIEEAILTAVQYNRRSWRYIEAILARWEEGDSRGAYDSPP